MAKIDDLTAAVAAQSTVEDGIITLLKGVSQQLADLKAAGGASPAQLDEVLAGLNANTQKLADAVVANTPSA